MSPINRRSSDERVSSRKTLKQKESECSSKPMSDESFSELLNDLGSPFKTFLTHETLCNVNISPKFQSARKRRRSWGSPESSGNGSEFQGKIKAANEQTPARQHIRRVNSDLAHIMKNPDGMPTSTPLTKKWKRPLNER